MPHLLERLVRELCLQRRHEPRRGLAGRVRDDVELYRFVGHLILRSGRWGTLRVCASWSSTTSRAVREALERALRLEGYEVELAADGAGGAASRSPGAASDAIVLDVLMPGIDGLEVCRALRAAGDRDAGADADRARRRSTTASPASTRAPTTTSSSRSRSRSCSRACARCCAARSARDGRAAALRRPARSTPARTRSRRGDRADRAHPHRVPPARAVPAQPAPGADARRHLRPRLGLRLRPRLELARGLRRATCAARPRRTASRG